MLSSNCTSTDSAESYSIKKSIVSPDWSQKSSLAPQIKSERLREKLLVLEERFVGFEKAIEEEAHRRRLDEQEKINDLIEYEAQLTKAVRLEVKRRHVAEKTLQALTEQKANEMIENIQKSILTKMDRVAKSVEDLATRSNTLERGLMQFRGELPSKLSVDASALQKEISELSHSVETDTRGWVDRDTRISEQLSELTSKLVRKVETECSKRMREMCEVEEMIKTDLYESHVKSCSSDYEPGNPETESEKFQVYLVEEIETMKNCIRLESDARLQTDEEILAAVNQCTDALEKSLRQLNSRHK